MHVQRQMLHVRISRFSPPFDAEPSARGGGGGGAPIRGAQGLVFLLSDEIDVPAVLSLVNADPAEALKQLTGIVSSDAARLDRVLNALHESSAVPVLLLYSLSGGSLSFLNSLHPSERAPALATVASLLSTALGLPQLSSARVPTVRITPLHIPTTANAGSGAGERDELLDQGIQFLGENAPVQPTLHSLSLVTLSSSIEARAQHCLYYIRSASTPPQRRLPTASQPPSHAGSPKRIGSISRRPSVTPLAPLLSLNQPVSSAAPTPVHAQSGASLYHMPPPPLPISRGGSPSGSPARGPTAASYSPPKEMLRMPTLNRLTSSASAMVLVVTPSVLLQHYNATVASLRDSILTDGLASISWPPPFAPPSQLHNSNPLSPTLTGVSGGGSGGAATPSSPMGGAVSMSSVLPPTNWNSEQTRSVVQALFTALLLPPFPVLQKGVVHTRAAALQALLSYMRSLTSLSRAITSALAAANSASKSPPRSEFSAHYYALESRLYDLLRVRSASAKTGTRSGGSPLQSAKPMHRRRYSDVKHFQDGEDDDAEDDDIGMTDATPTSTTAASTDGDAVMESKENGDTVPPLVSTPSTAAAANETVTSKEWIDAMELIIFHRLAELNSPKLIRQLNELLTPAGATGSAAPPPLHLLPSLFVPAGAAASTAVSVVGSADGDSESGSGAAFTIYSLVSAEHLPFHSHPSPFDTYTAVSLLPPPGSALPGASPQPSPLPSPLGASALSKQQRLAKQLSTISHSSHLSTGSATTRKKRSRADTSPSAAASAGAAVGATNINLDSKHSTPKGSSVPVPVHPLVDDSPERRLNLRQKIEGKSSASAPVAAADGVVLVIHSDNETETGDAAGPDYDGIDGMDDDDGTAIDEDAARETEYEDSRIRTAMADVMARVMAEREQRQKFEATLDHWETDHLVNHFAAVGTASTLEKLLPVLSQTSATTPSPLPYNAD